jgi:hypothetical protein
MVPWRSAFPIVLCTVLAVACGGNSVSGPSRAEGGGGNPASSGQAVTLRGGERLAWDQVAATVQVLQALTFTLWVDGAATRLSGVSCSNVRSSNGYECSGGLPSMAPGLHSLELSAISNGLESGRSSSMAVMMAGSSQAPE